MSALLTLFIRFLASLIPKPESLIKTIAFIICLPMIIIVFFSFPANIAKYIPIIKPSQVQIYINACEDVSKGKDLQINWRHLVAIEAVVLENNFKKTNYDRAVKLANRFVLEKIEERTTIAIHPITRKKITITETITVYEEKPFDVVLQELVNEGILKSSQLEDIYGYSSFNMDSLKDVGDGSDIPPDWKPAIGTYKWPLLNYFRLSSKYGPRFHPTENIDSFHHGIDIPAPKGTDVLATKDGTVKDAGYLSLRSGKGVIILHADGSLTRYFHLSAVSVKRGNKVTVNQKIGEVGSTGYSTGNHLHYEIIIKGKSVDPLKFYNK